MHMHFHSQWSSGVGSMIFPYKHLYSFVYSVFLANPKYGISFFPGAASHLKVI